MQGIDSLNLQVRPNLIYVEGGGAALKVLPEQGRQLDLREGQVINGTISSRAEGNVLSFGGKSIVLPSNFGTPGENVTMRVSFFGGVFLISKILSDRALVKSNSPQQVGLLEKRFLRLLRTTGFFYAKKFFSEEFLSNLRRTGILDDTLTRLNNIMLPSEPISGRQLKEVTQNTGLLVESFLKKTSNSKQSEFEVNNYGDEIVTARCRKRA